MNNDKIKNKVREMLNNPLDYEWEIQGFGMLRTYIDANTRVQIWHNNYKIPNVTDIHTHPWDFTSFIIQGYMQNLCFIESKIENETVPEDIIYNRCLILTGEHAYVKEKTKVILSRDTNIKYTNGMEYTHKKDVPHRTEYSNGTITVLTKNNINKDSLAYSYTKGDSEWVSAAPRIATNEEVMFFVNEALELEKTEKFLKAIAGKGYYSGSRQLDQEIDLELNLHKTNINGIKNLIISKGKCEDPNWRVYYGNGIKIEFKDYEKKIY